ncbi:MAG: hypothetical protein ACPKNR_02400 [Pleomorphochaeta sp.]|jgi:membrane protein YdbS with pleckstrin-like domain
MKKIEKKILVSLFFLIISIVIGFTLLAIVYDGNVYLEALVAVIVIFMLIVLSVLFKNFFENFRDK